MDVKPPPLGIMNNKLYRMKYSNNLVSILLISIFVFSSCNKENLDTDFEKISIEHDRLEYQIESKSDLNDFIISLVGKKDISILSSNLNKMTA